MCFALGEELIDPDTKESLGREEVKVGKVKISQVNPKTSLATILEDTGIDTGAVLRKARATINQPNQVRLKTSAGLRKKLMSIRC